MYVCNMCPTSIHVHVYVYVCVYLPHMNTYPCSCVCVCVHLCHTHEDVCMFVCMCVYYIVHIHTYMKYAYVHICTYPMCKQSFASISIRTHTYIYICIGTRCTRMATNSHKRAQQSFASISAACVQTVWNQHWHE